MYVRYKHMHKCPLPVTRARSISSREVVREHVIPHSVNVNSKIQTWWTVLYSLYGIKCYETQTKLLLPRSGIGEEAKTSAKDSNDTQAAYSLERQWLYMCTVPPHAQPVCFLCPEKYQDGIGAQNFDLLKLGDLYNVDTSNIRDPQYN